MVAISHAPEQYLGDPGIRIDFTSLFKPDNKPLPGGQPLLDEGITNAPPIEKIPRMDVPTSPVIETPKNIEKPKLSTIPPEEITNLAKDMKEATSIGYQKTVAVIAMKKWKNLGLPDYMINNALAAARQYAAGR